MVRSSMDLMPTQVVKKENLSLAFLLGAPGSGKNTQCKKIIETFGYEHLCPGDILDREFTSPSEYGTMILNRLRRGKIVSAGETAGLIRLEMESSKNSKFLIDAFPFDEEHRIVFERLVGVDPDVVLFLDCPEKECVKRMLNRDKGRVDGNTRSDVRFNGFRESMLPVVNHYLQKGKAYKIDAVGTEDEVFERIRTSFAAVQDQGDN